MKTTVEIDTVRLADAISAIRSKVAVIDIAIDGLEPIKTRNPAIAGLRALCEEVMGELEGVSDEIHPPRDE